MCLLVRVSFSLLVSVLCAIESVFYEIVFQFVRMCLIVSEHVFCVLIKVWYIDKRVFCVSDSVFSFTEGLLCMLMRVYYV